MYVQLNVVLTGLYYIQLRLNRRVKVCTILSALYSKGCLSFSFYKRNALPVQRAGLWKKIHRAATAAIPRRCEARHEGCRHQHRDLGEPSSQPVQVERSPNQTPQIGRGEADTSRHREMAPQKTKRQPRQTRDRAQMQPL